jgi:hypothetical protein
MRFPLVVLLAAACGTRGPSSSAVADCEASVDAVKAACVAEDPTSNRLCLYDALRPLCASGRTDYVKAVFDCLKLDGCQSPSDPSGAGTCVDDLVTSTATSADKALGAAICACEGTSPEPGCSSDLPQYSLATTMVLNESDVQALTTCITGSATCDQTAINTCANASPLQPANGCP